MAQTEQGKSEVSCVLEDVQGVVMAKPMILYDDTPPTHFIFANQVGVQTDERVSAENPCRTNWVAPLISGSQTTPQTALSSNRLFWAKKNLEWCYKKVASGKESYLLLKGGFCPPRFLPPQRPLLPQSWRWGDVGHVVFSLLWS